MMRRTARRGATVLLLGTAGLVATMAFGSSAALASVTDDDDGIGITIEVTPGPVAPAPAGTTTPAPATSRPSTPTKPAADVVAPVTEPAVPADGEVDLGGILFVSGLTSVYDWSINPLDGATETSFTVRNVSKSTFSSTVRFWADGPLGNRLSEVTDVKVTDLKPGETRTLEARLGGIGQSTFVQVHATLTPPKVVDGVELDSITRDQFVVIPPWGVASLGGLGVLGFAVYSLMQFLGRPMMPFRLGGVPA
ncbi:hypothetical protein [Conyzicola sp.]|uniref:hypothetical protein n=1 Tax=Conyzicola sp. TaxID=1969404 RepID=UPI003989A598